MSLCGTVVFTKSGPVGIWVWGMGWPSIGQHPLERLAPAGPGDAALGREGDKQVKLRRSGNEPGNSDIFQRSAGFITHFCFSEHA